MATSPRLLRFEKIPHSSAGCLCHYSDPAAAHQAVSFRVNLPTQWRIMIAIEGLRSSIATRVVTTLMLGRTRGDGKFLHNQNPHKIAPGFLELN